MGPPPHEKLVVYRRALEAAALLSRISIPRSRPDLRDQLDRASASIVLNLAEGASEFKPAEKSRFYRMARRSAGECLAILDLLNAIDKTSEDAVVARGVLEHVMALSTLLIQATDSRGSMAKNR